MVFGFTEISMHPVKMKVKSSIHFLYRLVLENRRFRAMFFMKKFPVNGWSGYTKYDMMIDYYYYYLI